MRRDFVNEVSRALKIKRGDLIEKDFILHQILLDLSKDKFFHENFLFKGGTCLIKCYLGYFRFSEDIDFTWKDQRVFDDMSQKEIRRHLSGMIDKIGGTFERIAGKRGMEFRCEKQDKNYVELAGGNKTVTFKMWYLSEILDRRSFIKVQINFVEKLKFQAKKKKLKSLLDGGRVKELKVLYPNEYGEYSRQIAFNVYDIREIFCEKTRAILTRRGIKARDFVDAYFISKKFGIEPEKLEKDIEDKVGFILNLYSRYRSNLDEKRSLLESGEVFAWGHERALLLYKIDQKEFYEFLKNFVVFLRNIAKAS